MTWTRQARGRLGLVLWACRGPDVFMCDHSFNPVTTLSLRVSHQEVVFAPRVIGSVWRHLLVVTPGTWGVEARDTATHPAVRRPAPAAENSWALDISGAKVASLGLYTHVCVCLCVRTRTCIYTCECLFACVAGTSGFKSVHLTTPGIFHTRHKVFLWCVNSIPIGLLNHQVLSGRVCGTGSTRRCDRECAAVRLGTGGSSMMRNCSHGCLFCQYSS